MSICVGRQQAARRDSQLYWFVMSHGVAILIGVFAIVGFSQVTFAQGCSAPPTPVRDLMLVRYYTDKAGTQIDREKKRLNERVRRPLKQFLQYVTRKADDAVRFQDAAAARCALAWLTSWAREEAYLGVMGSKQAQYQRKWDLAGASLAYFKLRPWAAAEDRSVIEPWLRRWAGAARAFFDDRGRRRNNHWYWLGLGLAATALGTGDEKLWVQARGVFDDAMGDITAGATLPMESARNARALHYHTFAVTPLVVMAELGRVRNEDWYGGRGEKLHRLVALVARAHVNGEIAKTLASGRAAQTLTKPGFGWLPLYQQRFPSRLKVWPTGVKRSHIWLGGGIGALLESIERARSKRTHVKSPEAVAPGR